MERIEDREKRVGNATDEWWAEGQDRTGQEREEKEAVREGWRGTWGVDRRPSLCMAFSSTHVFALASLFLSNAKFKQLYVRTSAKRRSRSEEMLKIIDNSSRCRCRCRQRSTEYVTQSVTHLEDLSHAVGMHEFSSDFNALYLQAVQVVFLYCCFHL